MRSRVRWFVVFLASLAGPAPAQPAHKPAPAAPAAIGASDIFAALTQTDRPAEIEALRQVRDALNGDPDLQALAAARAQLTGLLQAEERREGTMPPALVMSGIASRIESALAGLEEARRASATPAPQAPPNLAPGLPAWLVPWLLPGLAALAAGLGVALVACLAGLASRGRQAEAAEELQETLQKIRRKLEAAGPAAGASGEHAHDLAEAMSGEASEAVQQASHAVDRLGNAARDAEARLRSSVEDAEVRLHSAAAMAGQMEQWVEALPDRLAETLQGMEARGLAGIEAAASRIFGGAAPLDRLPDLLAAYGDALAGFITQAASAAARLEEQSAAAGARLEESAAALPSILAAALHPALGEIDNGADLLAELSTVSVGQAAKLQDVIARADKLVHDLSPITQALEAASAQLVRQVEQQAHASACASEAAEALPARLAKAADAMEARLADCADTLHDRLGAMAGALAEAALGLPSLRDGLQDVSTQMEAAMAKDCVALVAIAASLASESATLREAAQSRVEAADRGADRDAATIQAMREIAGQMGALMAQLESAIDGSAAHLRRDAAALTEAASRIAREAEKSGNLPEGFAGVMTAVLSASQRLDENLSRLGEAGFALTEEAACIGHEARELHDGVEATRAAVATAARSVEAAVRRATEQMERNEQIAAQVLDAAAAVAQRGAHAPDPNPDALKVVQAALTTLEAAIATVQRTAARVQKTGEDEEAALRDAVAALAGDAQRKAA